MMTFKDPLILFLLILIPLIIFLNRKWQIKAPGISFPTEMLLSGLSDSLKVRIFRRMIILRMIILGLIIFALSRPQSLLEESRVKSEGIDIVLTLDSSTSMLAEDFKLNGRRQSRVEVIKSVVRDFINARPDDRLGLVTFSATSATICPLTLDHKWLLSNLERVKTGMLEDGTAIGTGIMVSLNRFRDSKAKSKIIILLTDGRNNAGTISPQTAAEAARALHVKIYCIGAGIKGVAPYPFQDVFGNTVYRNVSIDIDEDTLKAIAETTQARYFRATDTESLRKIYDEINKLEKVPFEELGYRQYKELFPIFLILALLLIFLEIILRNTILRTIP